MIRWAIFLPSFWKQNHDCWTNEHSKVLKTPSCESSYCCQVRNYAKPPTLLALDVQRVIKEGTGTPINSLDCRTLEVVVLSNNVLSREVEVNWGKVWPRTTQPQLGTIDTFFFPSKDLERANNNCVVGKFLLKFIILWEGSDWWPRFELMRNEG